MRLPRNTIRCMAALAPIALLSACFDSPSDLLGANANNIVRIDAVFALRSQIYYTRGAGKSIEVCKLAERKDLAGPCQASGKLSVERTSLGNYIVQFSEPTGNHFGLWFRTDESSQGKSGSNCFMWLGDGIVGNIEMSPIALQYAGTQIFEDLSAALRKVATEPSINRQQLLKIASAYERVISPLGSDKVRCLGDRIFMPPTTVEISGDNRHLQQFVPGPSAPN